MDTLDSVVPLKRKTIKQKKSAPWFNLEKLKGHSNLKGLSLSLDRVSKLL